jgi:L-seryl-tRNA(Ser) seleniumtransferase
VKSSSKAELYRQLPSVDELMHRVGLAALLAEQGQIAATDAIRIVLAEVRSQIASGRLDGDGLKLALSELPAAVERQLKFEVSWSLIPVINATGVILHTNLGRAPLSSAALEHIRETAGNYSNLEFDLGTGERGERDIHVDRLFQKLLSDGRSEPTGLSTIVVNNNAAAVLLALNTLAEDGEVIASRGELIEIGGSFRIPDILSKSNAVLHEVGTTNRTRLSDYEHAIGDKTRLLLRVHRSNFEMAGFTEQPGLEELVGLSRRRNIPLVEDLGSGMFFDLSSVGVADEPGVLASLRAGVDVVTYSGDKLLGGPQAGLLSGRSDLIARMRSNPLFRALRVDKLTYEALEATLLAYLRQDYDAIPVLRMIRLTKAEIGNRAEAILRKVQATGLVIELADGDSAIGGGAAPGASLPTRLLAVSSKSATTSELAARLRAYVPPVIARVEQGRLLFDLRTVFPEQDEIIAEALDQVASE